MSSGAKAKQHPKDGAGSSGLSAEERAAIKARASELKSEARRASAADKATADAKDMEAKIADMPEPDRSMATRLQSIVTEAAPELRPKLYYGQLGWAKDGKVIVFFRSGIMDKARYSTLGFSVQAQLDEPGGSWPTSFALEHLTDDSAKAIAKLVKRAVG